MNWEQAGISYNQVGDQWMITKKPTEVDARKFLVEEHSLKSVVVDSEAEVVKFLNDYMQPKTKAPEPKEHFKDEDVADAIDSVAFIVEPMVQNIEITDAVETISLVASVAYDTGIGPCTTELGTVECPMTKGGPEIAKKEAEALAEVHITKLNPDIDWSEFKKTIGIKLYPEN